MTIAELIALLQAVPDEHKGAPIVLNSCCFSYWLPESAKIITDVLLNYGLEQDERIPVGFLIGDAEDNGG